jgi:hypothetical protein
LAVARHFPPFGMKQRTLGECSCIYCSVKGIDRLSSLVQSPVR